MASCERCSGAANARGHAKGLAEKTLWGGISARHWRHMRLVVWVLEKCPGSGGTAWICGRALSAS